MLTGTPSLCALSAATRGSLPPAVCSPSESSTTVAGGASFGVGWSAVRPGRAAATERSIASPSAVPEPSVIWSSAARAASRSVVGRSTTVARVENETMPIEYPSGATSRKVRAAATAAASREGFTSVAVIEREVSSARMTVACSPGTESVARGRATPTINAASATSARANGSSLRMRRGAGADAATSAGVPNRAPCALRRRSPTIRSTTIAGIDEQAEQRDGRPEASSALPEMGGEDAEPVAARREHDVRGPRRGEVGGDLRAAPAAAASAKRVRRLASLVSTRRRAAGLGIARTTPRPRRRARPRAGRGSRRRARRAGRRGRGAAAASRAARGSRRRRRRAPAGARRRRAATAPAPARSRRPGRPRRRARAASRRGPRGPGAAATASASRRRTDVSPTRFPRTLAAWPSASATPDARRRPCGDRPCRSPSRASGRARPR